jgi:hypothetical protein
MKKIFLHIAILVLGITSVMSQSLNSTGKIDNLGTIKVKSGQVVIKQDTIDGRVELLQTASNNYYTVPNIVYGQLVVKNQGKKVILDNKDEFGTIKHLVVRDSLVLDSSASFASSYIGLNPNDVIAEDAVVNINKSEYLGNKDLIMRNENKQQDLLANGKFSRLNIDNPLGVNVKSGGFEITSKLTLSRGELKNSAENNFTMKDSTEIERYVGASLSMEPKFESSVNVTYSGKGSLKTTGEVPSNKSTLKRLKVGNTDSLILTRNVQVNDSLILLGQIYALKDTLTLASKNNPVFIDSSKSEIAGFLRRNNFNYGEKVYFHNIHTYIYFNDLASANGVSDILLDIRPRTYPRYDIFNTKVMRSFDLSTFDEKGIEVNGGFNGEFSYGWRNSPNKNYDETFSLASSFSDLLLQKWNGKDYDDLNSETPQMDNTYDWAYSKLDQLKSSGSFAIGLSTSLSIFLQANVLLEGSYQENSLGLMRTDLWNGMQGNLLLKINPNEFPFSLLKNVDYTSIKSVPDSVVDWIVLEFRNITNPNINFYKLLLVRYDGKIIDLNGNSTLRITKNDYDPTSMDSSFDIYVYHRNHNSLKTLNPIALVPENNSKVYDFTDPSFVLGGTAALKLVDITNDRRIFAMKAGYFINDMTSVTQMLNAANPFTVLKDYLQVWDNVSQKGYLLYDYNMDGIITTRDFNLSWNNRNKQ